MVWRREITGFTLAPLPVLAPLLLTFGVRLANAPSDGTAVISAMFELVLLTYGATLLVGLPVHLLLRWKRRASLNAYLGLTVITVFLVAGAFAVADRLVPTAVNDNPFSLHIWSRFGVTVTLGFTFAALLCVWVFWSVAVRQPKP